MRIREEGPKDYEAVYELVKEAFASAEHADGNEADLVSALRNSEAFLPRLSLVAESNEKIIGHILFTKAKVGNEEVLALAPLSVHPAYQRRGVGKALIIKGHEIAKELGYGYSVVLGSDAYYPKFGYRKASDFGIKAPFDVPKANFMAIRLKENAKPVQGVMKYAKEFGIE